MGFQKTVFQTTETIIYIYIYIYIYIHICIYIYILYIYVIEDPAIYGTKIQHFNHYSILLCTAFLLLTLAKLRDP